MQKLFRSLIAVGGLVGLAACGDDVSITPPNNPLIVSGAPVTAVQVGAKVQLSANKAATWTSSASNVASVDATGLVTAAAAGTASITATSTADVNEKASVTITVTAPAVRNVTVSPPNAIMLPGTTQGFVANVDADAGVARTVTWASSNTAVATVTAAGVVTAVAPGATTITATSTANTTVTGAASVTVRTPTPATISVQNITITGTNNVTANVNNIAGSIDVNMNVDPGEQVIQRVEVLIDGVVACTQNLSGAQVEALRLAATFESLEQVIVSCQINTAAFAAATGIANYFNGSRTLSARAILANGSDIATPSTPLIFNNISGVIAVVSNDNGADPSAAINPQTGLQWISGNATVAFTGVSYVQGTTVASLSCVMFGKTARTVALTNGTATVAYDEDPWSATDLDLGGYLTANAATGETVVCPSAVLSNGQPMPAPSGSVLLNYGSPANPTVGGNAAMPVLQVLRYDGVAPGVNSANGVLQNLVTSIMASVTTPWVNANSTLTPSATGSGTNVLGLPSLATLNAATAGTDVEEGVDNITVGVWVPVAGQTLPAATASNACPLTGLTSVTTGNQLAETTVSSAYPVRLVFKDALGNTVCTDLGVVLGGNTAIGADFTAPSGTIAGPVPNTGYNAAPPAWAVTATDNASGFTASPLRVSMTRLNVNNTTTCVIGTGGSCTAATQPLTFSSTGGSATEGYYTSTITLTDAAGNTTTMVTGQVNGFDVTVPAYTGGISLPAVIAGAASNTFTTTVTDNLDLGSIFGVVNYPGAGVSIQYQTQAVGTFGSPLEQTATNVGYVAADWIRCLNPATSFAVASNPPGGITLSLTDQTTLPSSNTTTLASAAFGANAQACTGAAGNVAINTFVQNAVVYPGTATQVDLDGATMVAASATTVALQAVADVPLNTSADPFSRVDFYYQNAAGNFVKIGTATAVLAQTQTNRTYTYNFTWDPAAPVQTGSVTVAAIGVDAQGDAVFAFGAQTVTIVP